MIEGHQWMDSNEITRLVKLIQSVDPESMLEIGVHEGATSKIILDNIPSIKKYIGIQPLNYDKLNEQQKTEIPSEPAKFVKESPHFNLIERNQGSYDVGVSEIGEVDVVFIDGDHSLFGVMNDSAFAMKVAKKLIIWHDYNDIVEVKPVVEFLREHIDILQIPSTWLVYHKI